MRVRSETVCNCYVVKFGGSSLNDEGRIADGVEAIGREVEKGSKLAVVVSAMGKTTDMLLQGARKLSGDRSCDPKLLDDILSMGERMSARIFAAALKGSGVEARYFDTSDEGWPLITDDSFGNARPLLRECEARIRRYVQPLLEKGVVAVIPGFIGKTQDGHVTTMGRGASDATAFILARYLGAKQVILVTDVDGIMTADPKFVTNPRRIREVSAEALAGLADSGIKFLQRKALKFKDEEIDVKVISYSQGSLDADGTLITGSFPPELAVELAHESPVEAITVVGKGMSDEPGLIHRIVETINRFQVKVIGVSANYDSLVIYTDKAGTKDLLDAIHEIVVGEPRAMAMAVRKDLALLKVRGAGLEETPGIIGKVSEPLRLNRINIVGMLTVTSSIMVFVDWPDRGRAMELMNEWLKGDR